MKISLKICFNFNDVMSVCLCVGMCMCILVPKKVRTLELLIVGIIGSCKKWTLFLGMNLYQGLSYVFSPINISELSDIRK